MRPGLKFDHDEEAFRCLDESDDALFYEVDRFVDHLDTTALETKACPYTVRSWAVMQRQGNVGFAYRLMYHRERDGFYCVPDVGFHAVQVGNPEPPAEQGRVDASSIRACPALRPAKPPPQPPR